MTRVLVLDTDPAERTMVQNRMSDLGHSVTAHRSGAAAIESAGETLFDLVLLSADLEEGLSGVETCRQLKALPTMAHVPVLMYSNQERTPAESNAAYEAHCEAFIEKSQMPVLDRIAQVMLRIKERGDELAEHNRMLELENKRLGEERQRHADMETLKEDGGAAIADRECSSGRPDGVLIVDALGSVLSSDRGACQLLGTEIEGKSLGVLAPSSGLEAFVRDARTESRDGFRFDLTARRGRPVRSLVASVVPMARTSPRGEAGRRIVLLLDLGKRRIAEEMLRCYERGIPRHQLGTMLEATRVVFSPEAIVGTSPATNALRRQVVETAEASEPVLVTGERGAGKTFIGRTLHYTSGATGAFLQLLCSSMSSEGLEAELFGYVKGAFPGAIAGRPGLFHLAQDGTVFLAEMALLPLDLQARVLDVIQKGTLTRMGATRKERVDVRLIASSSEDIDAAVAAGTLLPELRAMFKCHTLSITPLRSRTADIPDLIEHFLGRFGTRYEVSGIDEQVALLLEKHHWPGNVSALEKCLEEACTRARGGSIELAHMPASMRELHAHIPDAELHPAQRPAGHTPVGTRSLPSYTSPHSKAMALGGSAQPWDITDDDSISLDVYEKKALLRALHSCSGDKLAVARLLNLGKSTLYRKLKRFGIT